MADHSSASSTSANPAGLIVAGGSSRRFGSDKARHPVDGTPMIARVHRALAPVARPIVVSIGPNEPPYTDLLPTRVQHVRDQHSGAGPMAGLDAGLSAVESSWVLVCACDMPNVTPEGLSSLLTARAEEIDAVVGTANGKRHPLFALYRRPPVRAAVRTCLDDERYALHALLDRVRVRAVSVPPSVVHNVNRREDLGAE